VTITPDTKDWTWVLRRPCPECGFDAQAFPREEIGPLLRSNAAAWRDLIASRLDVRERPHPDKWSPLEYACHVRDVCQLYAYRLDLMLTYDAPSFLNWDQDATAVEKRYGEQEPGVVAGELVTAAAELADAFDAVHGPQWERTGDRSDGARFTVDSFARYFIHDPVHHLDDAGGGGRMAGLAP
jgi:DinB superfamily